jgi:hypothetical protein
VIWVFISPITAAIAATVAPIAAASAGVGGSCGERSAAWIAAVRAGRYRVRPPRRSAAVIWVRDRAAPRAGCGATVSTATASPWVRSPNAASAAG